MTKTRAAPRPSTPSLIGAAMLLAIAAHTWPAGAQGLNDKEAVDRIIGSEVREEEVSSATGDDRVATAIEDLDDQIDIVRKLTSLDRVDIVYLPDASLVEGGPSPKIASKLDEHKEAVENLRHELESNALLYHAINSRNVLIRDVLAVEFDADQHLVIFAAAKPAQ